MDIMILLNMYVLELALPDSAVVKNLPANTADTKDSALIPGSGRSTGEGNGSPFQYSYVGNPMDRGAWPATVHGVTKSQTQPCSHVHTHKLLR